MKTCRFVVKRGAQIINFFPPLYFFVFSIPPLNFFVERIFPLNLDTTFDKPYYLWITVPFFFSLSLRRHRSSLSVDIAFFFSRRHRGFIYFPLVLPLPSNGPFYYSFKISNTECFFACHFS